MSCELWYIVFEYRLYFNIIKIKEFWVFIHFQFSPPFLHSPQTWIQFLCSLKIFWILIWPTRFLFSAYAPGVEWEKLFEKLSFSRSNRSNALLFVPFNWCWFWSRLSLILYNSNLLLNQAYWPNFKQFRSSFFLQNTN